MVRRIDKDGETLYACDVCGFVYKEKHWSEKCQDYCTKHKACSLEITRHAVKTILTE
jgi:uncharacterized C2H2 Zn-finger protein